MIKKIGYLFLIFLISFIAQIAIAICQNWVVGIVVMFFGFFVVYPLVSFFYSKLLLSTERNRLLLSFACPAILTFARMLFYVIFVHAGTFMYADYLLRMLVLFVWCELWSLLGLIRKKECNVSKTATIGYLLLVSLVLVIMLLIIMKTPLNFMYEILLIVAVAFAYPLASFLYSKLLISIGGNRIAKSLIFSTVLTMSCMIVMWITLRLTLRHGILCMIIVFVWCELWSLLGLIRKKQNVKDKKIGDGTTP